MAATAPFDCRELGPITGHGFVTPFTIKDAELIYAGIMVAQDASPEVVQASDTAGLQVLGVAQSSVDNTDDGETLMVRVGIYRYMNDAGNPVSKADIGNPVFVHGTDAITICTDAGSTHKVCAGVCFDVESVGGCEYVWVDNTQCQIGLSGYRVGV